MRLCTILVILFFSLEIIIFNQGSSWMDHVWLENFDALLIATKEIQLPTLLLVITASGTPFSQRVFSDEVEVLSAYVLNGLFRSRDLLFDLL